MTQNAQKPRQSGDQRGFQKHSEQRYSTNAESQRQRLLAWLQSAPLTTTQARIELDIMHPAARVQELRERGHDIFTHWETVDTGKAKHRVGCYVLLQGSADDK